MDGIQIRECTTIDEFDSCIRLQREVFGLPELEISPRRHLIVSRQAGGWTLGAFVAEQLVGFVHPMQARNAYFNLNRLGVTVRSYATNFYGTDYASPMPEGTPPPGIDSDRLFAEWQLQSARVMKLAEGAAPAIGEPAHTIQIPADWTSLCKQEPRVARQEQLRVRTEFQNAFAGGLVCGGFDRSTDQPRYLLYERGELC